MKTKKLLTLLLLFLMSFEVLHAYVIDALDTHACEVSEYVSEFSQPLSEDMSDDICNIHAEFHNTFLVPEFSFLSVTQFSLQKPSSRQLSYEFTSYNRIVKPPIS